MKNAVRSARQLRDALEWRHSPTKPCDDDHDFPVFVPHEFIARMNPDDPHDPLLKQVLPDAREGDDVPGYSDDPVGDLDANVAPGLLHKYAGRALMITTGACGVHCRYCFRRQFPYIETAARRFKYAPAIEYLQNTPEIEEVLLSGGDPLTLTDHALSELVGRIEAVSTRSQAATAHPHADRDSVSRHR